jgi:hypothetical protein
MNKVLLAFLVGGFIIGSTNAVSTMLGPEYAAMVGGVPTGLIAPFFLNSRQKKKNFYWGYLLEAGVMAVIITQMYICIHMTGLSGYEIVSISAAIFMILSPLIIYFFGK